MAIQCVFVDYEQLVFKSSTGRDRDCVLILSRRIIVVVAIPGVSLSKVDLGLELSIFELLCVRVVSGALSFIAAAIYRPGFTSRSQQRSLSNCQICSIV
jgi:hypothetical protein